jgi:type II secretory pathway pseudopilin PulG
MAAKSIFALIVGIFIALIASIATPNFLKARDRSRQNRTMADIRSVATAWEARATDTNSYDVKSAAIPHSGRKAITPAELAHVLEPTYIRHLPRTDAWGNELQLLVSDFDQGRANTYSIRALGSDGRPDRDLSLSGITKDPADDVVFSNGSFIRYTERAG